MSGNLAEVRKKSGERSKVRERSGNLWSRENLIVAAQQKITVSVNNCFNKFSTLFVL